MEIAVACFVMTPDLCPVKPELAEALGAERAGIFYRKCIELMRESMREAARLALPKVLLRPHWAVAETAGLSSPLWSDFPKLAQGQGELGARLKNVFEDLKARYEGVILIDADHPLLSPQIIAYGAQLVCESAEHILGPSDDGGFYLFGTRHAVDLPGTPSIWKEVPYGGDWAAEFFTQLLESRGGRRKVLSLEPLFDVDSRGDFERLQAQIQHPEDAWAARVKRAFESTH